MRPVEHLLQGDGLTEVVGGFRWLSMPAAWIIVLVIVPVVFAAVWLVYRRERPAVRTDRAALWKWLLALLRTAVVLFVLFMLFRPVWRTTTFETRDSTVLVMVDDSLSMDVPDRYSDRGDPEKLARMLQTSVERIEETPRYELVRRILEEPKIGFLAALREKARVVVATFARSVRETAQLPRTRDGEGGTRLAGAARGSAGTPATSPGEEAKQAAEGVLPPYHVLRNDQRVQETRIGESLRDGISGVAGSRFGSSRERLAAVVLFSDGQENAGRVSPIRIARRRGEQGIPLYTVGVGDPEEPRDLRLVNVDANAVVLVDDEAPFDATIVSEGFEQQRVRVDLRIDSDVADTEYVLLGGDTSRQTVRLSYRPRKPGEYTATVEVERIGGEVFYENNSISKPLKVLDQKIKLLYVENLPRWEYRYLKNAFIRDPTMEAQVFLISADPGFVQESSPGVESLRTLPTDRAKILAYHVIILGDVDPQYLGDDVMAYLKEFVDEGGGLVFLAGSHANPSRYLHTDLYSLVPVVVPERNPFADGEREDVTSSFNVLLTPVGRQHPMMRLDNDPDRNARLWENPDGQFYEHLPGFYWYAEVGPEKAASVVLARHPERLHTTHNKGLVIFAYMNYGRGRTFFSAVDNTWRWRAGVENLYFYRFWGQVVRYVASGRLLGKTPRYQVSTDKDEYNIGETIRLYCRVFDANMNPSSEPSITLYHQVQGTGGDPPEKLELPLNRVKGQGIYEGAVTGDERGRHAFWLGSESDRVAFRMVTVEVPALESRDPRLNRQLLQEMAAASAGAYVDLPDVSDLVERVRPANLPEEGTIEDDDVWDEWWVAIAFTGLIALEWVLRKLVRLP